MSDSTNPNATIAVLVAALEVARTLAGKAMYDSRLGPDAMEFAEWCEGVDPFLADIPAAGRALLQENKRLRNALEGEDDELLEIGRRAVERLLVEFRDSRISEFQRGNGLVIREKDGTDSSIVRFGPEVALRTGMRAILAALEGKE